MQVVNCSYPSEPFSMSCAVSFAGDFTKTSCCDDTKILIASSALLFQVYEI